MVGLNINEEKKYNVTFPEIIEKKILQEKRLIFI